MTYFIIIQNLHPFDQRRWLHGLMGPVFRNMRIFYGRDLLTPRPTAKLEGHLFSAICDCLLTIFTAALLIWRPSSAHGTYECCGREPFNMDRNLCILTVVCGRTCLSSHYDYFAENISGFIARNIQLILSEPCIVGLR
jgi:hypothetical protein